MTAVVVCENEKLGQYSSPVAAGALFFVLRKVRFRVQVCISTDRF